MLETVRLQNGLLIHGGHTGIWAALEKGFYRDENIDCVIARGFGSERTLRDVAEGRADIGEVDLSVMWMARGEGLPVCGIGLLYHRAQHVLYALAHNGIASVADLPGKSIAAAEADAGTRLFPAFLSHAGLDPKTVKMVFIPAEEKVPTLLSGRVDALLTYVINGPAVEARAAEQGRQARGLLWADHGFDPVSNGFAASQTFLREKPDLVRRFLRATYRGVAWALFHPEEASALFSVRNPHIEPRLARLQWERTIPFVLTEDSRRTGLGYFADDKLLDTLRVLRRLFGMGNDSAEEAFTNGFLPEKAARLSLLQGAPSPGNP